MIKKFFKKICGNALRSLNITQFTGAFNDNFFQGIMIYFLIGLKGYAHASTITALCFGVMFLPTVVLLSYAGFLADKFRKTNVLFTFKAVEFVVMVFGLFAIYLQNEKFCYFLLFLMGAQTAFFAPSKYGILPEITSKDKLTSANVKVMVYTNIAILCGELFASFFTHVFNKNFYLIALLPIFVSIIGLFSARNIPKTVSQGVKSSVSPIFFVDIFRNFKLVLKTPFLLHAIFSGAIFWFVGAFVKMNLIPFLINEKLQILGFTLDDVSKGYIYIFLIVGGAIGANLVSRFNIKGLGGALCVGFLFPLFLFLIPFSSPLFLILNVLMLGIALTSYYIPIDVFIQESIAENERGRVISFHHLFSNFFMVLSAVFLYFFNSCLGFSAAKSFIIIGFIAILLNLYLCFRLAYFVFPSFSKNILARLYNIILATKLPRACSYVILSNRSLIDFFFFFSFFSKGKAVVLLNSKRWSWIFKWLSKSISTITFIGKEDNDDDTATKILSVASSMRSSDHPVLIRVPENTRGDILRLCNDATSSFYLMRSTKTRGFRSGKLQNIHYYFENLLE